VTALATFVTYRRRWGVSGCSFSAGRRGLEGLAGLHLSGWKTAATVCILLKRVTDMERSCALLILLLLALPTQATVQVYYLHNDHLGTPRVVTNQAREVVWKGQLKPFGETSVEVEAITNHRRFPGQRFDIESRLYYNYFRDYDPTTGRYVQSDPIGIVSGLSTYTYVKDNPISLFDPYGLFGQTVQGALSGRRGRGAGAGLALVDAFTWPNGNFTPDFQNQDGGRCSLPGKLATFGDSCIPKVCQDHDTCFQKNYCNATSWFSWALGGTKSCNQCDENAFQAGAPLVMNAIGF
jgi:RHS repeat-associated protein